MSEQEPLPHGAYEERRALTADEHHALLRMINAPGGARHRTLGINERTHLSALPPVRDAAAVQELRHLLAEEPPGSPFVEGIAAALDYAYGQSPTGPVSGEHPRNTPPTCSDLYAEEAFAYRVIRRETLEGIDQPIPRHPDYVVGVEHTLMYLQCRTDDPPLGPLR